MATTPTQTIVRARNVAKRPTSLTRAIIAMPMGMFKEPRHGVELANSGKWLLGLVGGWSRAISTSIRTSVSFREHVWRWTGKGGGVGDFAAYSKLGLIALLAQVGLGGMGIICAIHMVRNRVELYALLILSST